MSPKLARTRYMKLFIPSMILYLVGIFIASTEQIINIMPNGAIYGLVIIPAIGVFGWIYAQMRFVKECDEYIRKMQIEAILYGVCALMCVATVWGLLEFYTNVPKLPIFFALPGFYLFYGLAGAYLGWKNKAMCAML